MSVGTVQVFTVGAASGASTSSFMDVGGKSYTQFAFRAATMSTGALVTVYGCDTSAGTYYPIQLQSKITASVQYNTLQVPTTSSGTWAVFDSPPFRYLQFITSAVVSGGVSYTVIAFD